MSKSIEKAQERLRKLLTLAENDGASPGEIENAVKAAESLMAQYQLTREDVTRNKDGTTDLSKIEFRQGTVWSYGAKRTPTRPTGGKRMATCSRS